MESNDPSTVIEKVILKKYLHKDCYQPDMVFARVRKPGRMEWELYYRSIDECCERVYGEAPIKTVFFLNFQVNHGVLVYPQEEKSRLERSRTNSLIMVKAE